MLSAVAIGLIAAFTASIPALLHSRFPNGPWAFPAAYLAIAGVALLLNRFVFQRQPALRRYDGIADLQIHVHSPSMPDSSLRWAGRGLLSLLLGIFGQKAGPEGAATELAQAFAMRTRSRSARWFEQRRRTDAGAALAAGISAAFGAPFAGAVFPIEKSFGGRATHAIIASLVAFLAGAFLRGQAIFEPMLSSAVAAGLTLGTALEIAVVACLAGALAAGLVRFAIYAEKGFRELLKGRSWFIVFAGGFLLFLAGQFYPAGMNLPEQLLPRVFSGELGASETGLLLFSQLFSIAIVVSCLGSVGLVWPVFAAGAVFGVVAQLLGSGSPQGLEVAMAGAAGLTGAVFGAPIACALLAFELTRSIPVLVFALLSAFSAVKVRQLLRTGNLIDLQLRARGVSVVEGRAQGVLESVLVRDAMTTDFISVHEHETVSELHAKVQESRYPFVAVVSAQGKFSGLLTVDVVQEAWSTQASRTSNSPLARLLTAKDLLYRSRSRPVSIRSDVPISESSGKFQAAPCIAVIDENQRAVGLLFVANVRLAYDREFARRSLLLENWS